MAKKCKCPECKACEDWAVPTADFFSLLLALFIALYAIASQNKDKMKSMSKAFAEIFDFRPLTLSLIPPLDQMAQTEGKPNSATKQEISKQSQSQSKEKVVTQAKQLMQDLNKLNDIRDEQGNGSETEVIMTEEGIRIRMLNSIVFGDGSAELNPAARKVVDLLSIIVKQYPNDIKVEGHTAEPSPPKGSPYPSNWELSSARASSVVRALVEKGYNPKRFTVVGFADTKPLSVDEAAKKHFMNQRVDIVLMKYENKIDDLPSSSVLDSKNP